MSRMRRAFIFASAALAGVFASTVAPATDPDEDQTPLGDCDSLPAPASIEVFSKAQTQQVCLEIVKILEGATISDLRQFSKVAYILSRKGYQPIQQNRR